MFDKFAIPFAVAMIALLLAPVWVMRGFRFLGRVCAAALMRACESASDFVDAMGAARRRFWAQYGPDISDKLNRIFAPIIPYARSRTNWVTMLQYIGIVFATPLSAADLESMSTRAWLAASAVLFVAGILFRGRKEPSAPTAAEADYIPRADTHPGPRFFASEPSDEDEAARLRRRAERKARRDV